MTCLEHLVENGICLLEEHKVTPDEWRERMKKDSNWKGVDCLTIEDLWKRFRGYLSLKVLNVFMDKKILDIIFKEYKDIKNENKTMICK